MSITAAEGFVAAGCHAGVKRKRFDLALLATEDRKPVRAAAVFTQNKFVAPPVLASRDRLLKNGGQAAAVIINSGNANAGTGDPGRADSEAMCAAAAEAAGCSADDVLVCSTGIIGTPLPMDKILGATPRLAKKLSCDGDGDAAKAILTTDSVPKQGVVAGSNFTLGGMAKGCGMLAPNMATMLAFLTTDADIPVEAMQRLLGDAADRTFNRLNVDGATSTNDTVFLLSSARRGKADLGEFRDALERLCEQLTLMMARDAEGMTRLVRLHVTGAANDSEARIAAKAIAENNLVKCSWHGGDPYWGRLLAAAGAAGVQFETAGCSVSYGGIEVSRGGTAFAHDADAVREHVKGKELTVEVNLGIAAGSAQIVGVDLGHAYITENSRTS